MEQQRYNLDSMADSKIIVEDIIKKYEAGLTIIQIARIYKITYYKTRQILLDNNIRIRPKFNRS